MTSQTWILLSCVLLSALPGSQGVEFTAVRAPGNYFCARARCSHDISGDVTSVSSSRITIYDVTQAGKSIKVASIARGDAALFIDPGCTANFNGTGVVTEFRAEVTLDIHKEADCLSGVFLCQVELIVKGKKEIINQTISCDKANDCRCSSITDQFTRLTTRANEAVRQVTVLRITNADLDDAIAGVRQTSNDQEKVLAAIQQRSEVRTVELAVISQTSEDAEENIAELAHSDGVMKAEITELEKRSNAREAALAALKTSAEAKKGDINYLYQNDKKFDDRLSNLKNTVAENDETISELNRKAQDLDRKVIDLARSTKLMRVDINGLNYKERVVKDDLASLKQTELAQTAAVDGLSQIDEARQAEIYHFQQKNTALAEAVRGLAHNKTLQSAQINLLKQVDKAVNEQLSVVENSNRINREELVVFRQRDKGFDEAFGRLVVKDNDLLRQIDELVRSFKATQEQGITGLQASDLTLEGKILVLRQREVSLQASFVQITSSYSNLEQRAIVLRQQNAALISQMAVLSGVVVKLQASFSATHVTTLTRTTTILEQSEQSTCKKGMPHTQPREKILILGSVQALCDTETNGGGWVVLERRTKGDVSFNRSWAEYKNGFGTLDTDFYLGNKFLHELTAAKYNQLRIDLIVEGKSYYAEYSHFSVGDEASYYKLTVSGYSGTAGDGLKDDDGMCFSTYDQDHDTSPDNCAAKKHGGFWFSACGSANLDGLFGKTGEDATTWSSFSASVSYVEMKVRLVS